MIIKSFILSFTYFVLQKFVGVILMTEFTQDKIFKNVNEEDAKILLDILGIKSDTVKIWTKELRLLDPKDYRPDIIVELNDINLIIELQSTDVDDEFSKGH